MESFIERVVGFLGNLKIPANLSGGHVSCDCRRVVPSPDLARKDQPSI